MHYSSKAGLAVAMLITAVTAQEPVPPSPTTLPSVPLPGDGRVPIHTHPWDATGYGTWGGGASYKASFHDGFVFFPVLGMDYPENLPLRWRTQESSRGTRALPLAAEAAGRQVGEWRYEYDHGAMVEAYELRTEGIEQTFHLAQRPEGSGAFVIRGVVETPLDAEPRALEHAPILFHDGNGREILSYGAAFAFDAAGSWTEVATSFSAGTIELHVDGAWLDAALFPVTIDPLLSRQGYDWPSVSETDVGADGLSQSKGILAAFTVVVSASDTDIRAYLADEDFTGGTIVYSDLDDNFQTEWPSVAYVGGASKWVLAFQKKIVGNGTWYLAAYTHSRQNIVPFSGGAPASFSGAASYLHPDVGGIRALAFGQQASIVFESDASGANTTQTEVRGMFFTVPSKTFSSSFPLTTSGQPGEYDRELPSVNQESDGSPSEWIAVWQERVNSTGDSFLRGRRIASNGSHGVPMNLTHTGPNVAEHCKHPQVAGSGGRYMLTCLAGSNWTSSSGTQLLTVRFDWNAGASVGSFRKGGKLVALPEGGFTTLRKPRIAYDRETRSHWAITYERAGLLGAALEAQRVGWSGGSVEIVSPTADGRAPSVTYDSVHDRFLICYWDTQPALYCRAFVYSPQAGAWPLGTSCGGHISGSTPHAGSEFFRVELSGATGATAVLLYVALGQSNYPLDGIGMTGCSLYLNPASLIPIEASVQNGAASVQLPLPDAPAFIGDAYAQWIAIVPGANALNLVTTERLHVLVR